MRRFRLSPLAKSDLAEIRHYIRQDKPAAADRQIAKFFHTFHTLTRNSELGQRRPEFGLDLRTFSVGNYVIVYRPFCQCCPGGYPEGIVQDSPGLLCSNYPWVCDERRMPQPQRGCAMACFLRNPVGVEAILAVNYPG